MVVWFLLVNDAKLGLLGVFGFGMLRSVVKKMIIRLLYVYSLNRTKDGLDYVGELNHSGLLMLMCVKVTLIGLVFGLNR